MYETDIIFYGKREFGVWGYGKREAGEASNKEDKLA